MIIKRIASNGGIYFDVDTEQQKKLRPMLRLIFRITIDICHTCACRTDKIVFNATISEMQCIDCFNDWTKHYILSEEDYKRQAYNADAANSLLSEE